MEKNRNGIDQALRQHPIVPQDEWIDARKELLKKEKKLTKLYDQLCEERRALPWVEIDKPYIFDSPGGKATLQGLFKGNSQLIVQHFMFAPEWEEGCLGCSFGADHVDGALKHVENHDVSYVAISRAPLSKIEAYKKRMGWEFDWVSSYNSDFNFDFNVSFGKENIKEGKIFYNYELQEFDGEELPGTSVFYKDGAGKVFLTYSAFARGDEFGIGAYMMLDNTPKGRNENGPHFDMRDWVRRHDQYEKQSRSSNGNASCCN